MNTKIDFDDLISLVAAKSGKERYLCESFVKDLINTFNKQLITGECITIDGLGVFTLNKRADLVDDDQLKEGRMFSFYPDLRLVEAVNKPFSAFEVTELIDSALFKDIVSVKELSIDIKTESIEWIEIKEEPIISNEPKAILSEQPPINESCTVQHSVKTNKLEFVLAGLVLFLFISLSFFIWIIYNNSSYQLQNNTEEYKTISKNEIKQADLDLHTLLLDTAFIELCSDSANEITDKRFMNRTDSILIADSTVKNNVKSVTEKYIATEVIKRGSTLTALALKYYDHKIFWVYIYEANKIRIDDPNNIRIGTIINLPIPETYGIDARNKESRLSAIQKQKEILE